MTVFSNVVGFVFVMVFGPIINGYVLSVLWRWFIVPTFDAPALGVVSAIGVAMVVSYLTYQTHDCKKEKKSLSNIIKEGANVIAWKASLALFFGWIVHLFM